MSATNCVRGDFMVVEMDHRDGEMFVVIGFECVSHDAAQEKADRLNYTARVVGAWPFVYRVFRTVGV